MLHRIEIDTDNPAARALTQRWGAQIARAAWDADPLTGRTYPARVTATVYGPGDAIDRVPLTGPATRSLMMSGLEAYLAGLADDLAPAAAAAAPTCSDGWRKLVESLLSTQTPPTLPAQPVKP